MTTISQERSKLAAVKGAPALRRRESWRSAFSYTGRFTVTEPATRAFIHISVTNPGNYNSNDAHARALESIGRQRFPNTGVSYNRGCMLHAALYELQPIGRQGAHTVNDFRRSTCSTSGCPGRNQSLTAPSWNLNVNARAYVICQNVGDPVSDAQVDALARAIVADYLAGFITLHAAHHPHGHRCVSSKSCPGDLMWAKMPALHDRIHHYLDNGLPGGTTPPRPPEDDMTPDQEKRILDAIAAVPRAADIRWGKILSHRNNDILVAMSPRVKSIHDALLAHLADGAGLDPDQLADDVRAAAKAGTNEALGEQAAAFAAAVVEQVGNVEVSQDSLAAAIEQVLREGVGEPDEP